VRIPALGPRGEGWVALQFVALGAALAIGLLAPGWNLGGRALDVAGLVLAAAGAALALAGVRGLGSSLTALPKPHDTAELKDGGIYAHVRHPLYGSLLLLVLGWCLLTSPWVLLAWAGLLAVLSAKSSREEAWLVERYDGYAAYRARVRPRFVPWLI
jgi:protein-S-isoprenylcysteine O-methyltransferase Ste14